MFFGPKLHNCITNALNLESRGHGGRHMVLKSCINCSFNTYLLSGGHLVAEHWPRNLLAIIQKLNTLHKYHR